MDDSINTALESTKEYIQQLYDECKHAQKYVIALACYSGPENNKTDKDYFGFGHFKLTKSEIDVIKEYRKKPESYSKSLHPLNLILVSTDSVFESAYSQNKNDFPDIKLDSISVIPDSYELSDEDSKECIGYIIFNRTNFVIYGELSDENKNALPELIFRSACLPIEKLINV